MAFCYPYVGYDNSTLIEGVDYEVDLPNGRIKFLSTGALGPTINDFIDGGGCGVDVQVCCAESDCLYLESSLYGCDGACYVQEGYDTVFQEGAEDYRSSDEKMIKRATLEAEPEPESSPPELQCDIGFAKQPNCMTWKAVRPLLFECQSNKTAAQHAADRTRPDDSFHFPTWQRGQYISTRFRVSGIGGAGDFSAIHKLVKGWGQHDAP